MFSNFFQKIMQFMR